MPKLLINAPTGAQEVIDIGQGGGYFDPARVLWDERIDGPLPAITLGGMARTGNDLAFSQARMDEHLGAINRPAVQARSDGNAGVRLETQKAHLRKKWEEQLLALGNEDLAAVLKTLDELHQLEKSAEE